MKVWTEQISLVLALINWSKTDVLLQVVPKYGNAQRLLEIIWRKLVMASVWLTNFEIVSFWILVAVQAYLEYLLWTMVLLFIFKIMCDYLKHSNVLPVFNAQFSLNFCRIKLFWKISPSQMYWWTQSPLKSWRKSAISILAIGQITQRTQRMEYNSIIFWLQKRFITFKAMRKL